MVILSYITIWHLLILLKYSQTCFEQPYVKEHSGPFKQLVALYCYRSKVMQKAPVGAFCITFELY